MRCPDLDIDLLRCFVTVTERQGFTAAGQTLGLTQSAISLKIKRLEDLIGKRVFERTSRSLALTADGEVLLSYARRLLSLNDEAVRRMIAPSVHGHLRLGIADHFVPHHLAPILARFARTYPDVQLEVEVGRSQELRAACERGRLDLVIGKRREGEQAGIPIWTEPLTWAAAPDFVLPRGGPAERADGAGRVLPLAMLTPGCMYRDRALSVLANRGIPHEIVYTSASLLGVIAAVQAGLGVTVLGSSSLPDGLVGGLDLPALGTAEMAVFGDTEGRMALVTPLIGLIRDSIAATVSLRSAA
ncbi:LysR substrate-binding domain-containing protein [Acidisphaera rubrifaciens]|uniref:Transcriptional regulator LysR n=1 Tax=Acidisphaera rubrifaciens HS-AP3 TaxID=1231350 RepID=A0A0D6PBB6_9PROT|nr:LysR substrate-binding domain-containing protein [Acidisphaera rubrifaciens]GAN78144.1 transcriptional regulator LysR [Acidisphaera rubrifaciens HS-AP3]